MYWELKYQQGELRLRVQRMTGEPPPSPSQPPSPPASPAQPVDSFVSLQSLKR
jgi:hypothetical protein